jgi:hypothetical protein
MNVVHWSATNKLVINPWLRVVGEIRFFNTTPYTVTLPGNQAITLSPTTSLTQKGSSFSSSTSGQITFVGTSGSYFVLSSYVGVASSNTNKPYFLELRVNGTSVAQSYYHGQQNLYDTASMQVVRTLNNNDVVTMTCTNLGGTETGNFRVFSIIIQSI